MNSRSLKGDTHPFKGVLGVKKRMFILRGTLHKKISVRRLLHKTGPRVLPSLGVCNHLPLDRDGGCHPRCIETSEPDGSTTLLPSASDCGSWTRVMPLIQLQRGAGGCNAAFDPNHLRPQDWATRTRPPGGNARMCLSMGGWVVNPTQGVPATVQPVTSCRLLRPLRDGRGAR